MRSFRLALALRTAGCVLALTLLIGTVSALALRTLLYRQLDGTLVHLAKVEAQAGAAHIGSEFEFHEGVLLAASPGPSAELTRYAQLWSSDGAPLTRSRNLTTDLLLPRNAVAAAGAGQIVWDTRSWRGERLRCVVYPLRLVGPAHGMHLLQVAAPLAPLERTLGDFIGLGLLLTVLAAGAAFVVGWRIAGTALTPTAEITAQAEAIREGTPTPTITAHADVDGIRPPGPGAERHARAPGPGLRHSATLHRRREPRDPRAAPRAVGRTRSGPEARAIPRRVSGNAGAVPGRGHPAHPDGDRICLPWPGARPGSRLRTARAGEGRWDRPRGVKQGC